MANGVVELSEKTAANVDRILFLLEGNRLQPGLITMVQANAEHIAQLKSADSRNSVSTSVLIGVAWLGVLLVPILTFIDRMILISDTRVALGLFGWYAVIVSLCFGLVAKVTLIFVVVVFTLRWMGWGRGVIDE